MIVLASTSATRRALLANAGIAFESEKPGVDERAVEGLLVEAGASPADVAMSLAEAKALAVSARRPGDLVIGSDQVLELAGERFHKPLDIEDAAVQLGRLAGRTHRLLTAAVLVRDGAVLWSHIETAALSMRPLDRDAIRRYLAAAGEAVLGSVGAYQLEGPGIRLFRSIEGDYFSILGLPLLPVLSALREHGAPID